MVYNQITFNSGHLAGMSFKQFCIEVEYHNLSKEQLKEAYDLCKAASKPENPTIDEVSNEKPD